jgi:hypothetical protein
MLGCGWFIYKVGRNPISENSQYFFYFYRRAQGHTAVISDRAKPRSVNAIAVEWSEIGMARDYRHSLSESESTHVPFATFSIVFLLPLDSATAMCLFGFSIIIIVVRDL